MPELKKSNSDKLLQSREGERRWSQTGSWFIVLLVSALVAVLTGGIMFYFQQKHDLRRAIEANLAIMADLKADQVTLWRKERFNDAGMIWNNDFVATTVVSWLANHQSETGHQIVTWLRTLQRNNQFEDVLLVGTNGEIQLSALAQSLPVGKDFSKDLAVAFTTRRPVLTDLYLPVGDSRAHLEIIVPIFNSTSGTPVGAILLRYEATEGLFPLIKFWPAANKSAEAVLARREKDSVLFLSDLQYRPGENLKFRLPLSRVESPAVQAVLGKTGVLVGPDYRGMPVLACARLIPNSSWLLLVKMDEVEALAEWRIRARLIIVVILALASVLSIVVVEVWSRRKRYQALAETFEALQKANRAQKILSECNQVLVRESDETELLEKICRHIVEIGGYRMAWVGFAEQDAAKSIRIGAKAGFEDGYLKQAQITWADTERGRGPTGAAIRTGQPVVARDFANNPTLLPWREEALKRGYAASVVLPLKSNTGKSFGVITIYAAELNAFEEAEYQLLLQLANNMAFGIHTLRLRAIHAQQESQHRSILAAAMDGFWVVDLQGRLLEVNASYCRSSGYSEAELLAMKISDLDSIQTTGDIVAKMKKIVEQGELRFESQHRRKDGSLFDIEASVQFRPEDQTIVAFIHDITERKRLAAELAQQNQQLNETLSELRKSQQQIIQQQKLHALGQMASGIAHDFNNALSPIVGFSELLLKHPEKLANPKQARSWLENIHTCATDAAKLVRRIREFGKQQIDDEVLLPVDLNQVVLKAVELTEPRWKGLPQAAGHTIHVVTDLQPVPFVAGEETALREVLINLIFNSVDAMTAAGKITLRTAADEKFVRLSVSDTGPGMTEEVRRHCFEPFFTTKGEKGTGLGLAMVHGIVQRHGGTITLESELGRGTTLMIQLPIERQKSAPDAVTKGAALQRSLRVLVADDEPMVRDLIQEYLTDAGHSVEVVADGVAALTRLGASSFDFDIVITDQAMPEMNGEQLAVAIHQCRPGLPVILMTGFGDLMKAEGKLPPYVSAILSKPVTEVSLHEVLAKVVVTTA